jgi:hypothetical protein
VLPGGVIVLRCVLKEWWLVESRRICFVIFAGGVIFSIYFELMTAGRFSHPVPVYITTEIYVWLRYLALAFFQSR